MLSNRQHTATAFILALVCLYAIRLTSIEVQPWDEGLYAVRGQSIAQFGNWADQTQHTIGGRGQCPLAWCVLLHQPNVCVAPPIAGITRLGFVQFVEATVNRNSFSNCVRRNDIVVCIRHGDIQFCTNKKFALHRDVVAGSRSGFCLWP